MKGKYVRAIKLPEQPSKRNHFLATSQNCIKYKSYTFIEKGAISIILFRSFMKIRPDKLAIHKLYWANLNHPILGVRRQTYEKSRLMRKADL